MGLALLASTLGGCAALTNPTADGVPARRLPDELLGFPKEDLVQLPLTLLRQKPNDVYRLAAADVLGVYIEGVLGNLNQPPPVRLVEQSGLPPAMGYPVPVRDDGTVSLPLVPPIKVEGMTIPEAEEAVRQAYTVKKEILRPGRERIIVTLLQPRTYHVLVVRQDAGSGQAAIAPVTFGGFSSQTSEVLGPRKRGTGFNLELPAYENDVLNALTRSGGLPGLDARNEITIYRGYSGAGGDPSAALDTLQQCPTTGTGGAGARVIRIPLRLPAGIPPPFSRDDIILRNGDIVFIQSRDSEVFYTGGVLQSGQYPLPRDYDLDVVQAIALVRGTLINGGQNSNNLTGSTTGNSGAGGTSIAGFPNPSLVSIIRHTPHHGQIIIRVNLNRALQDRRENVLIQPNDVIILQSTVGEALTQYFATHFFELNFVGTILRHSDAIATTTISSP